MTMIISLLIVLLIAGLLLPSAYGRRGLAGLIDRLDMLLMWRR